MSRVIWDEEPIARKRHECSVCYRTIKPGEKYRRTRGKFWEDDNPYTWKQCAHCRAFVRLYLDDFCYDLYEGWTREDIEEWEPQTDLAREHKRQWSIRWRDGPGLHAVPVTEAVAP